jgi:sodium transport system permease protein
MNRVWVVFRKEASELFRDRRVTTGAFIGPVFMVLMFVFLFGMIQQQVDKPPPPPVAVVSTRMDKFSETILNKSNSKRVDVATLESAKERLAKGEVRLAVEFGPDLEASIGRGAKITVFYDQTEPMSQIALARFREAVLAAIKPIAERQLEAMGIEPDAAQPVQIDARTIPRPPGLGGSPLIGLLPYLVVLWAFYGGFGIASDLVTGEKDKGTLETLLVSPVERREVAFGKFLALCLVCLLSSMATFVAITACGALRLQAVADLFPTGLQVTGASALVVAMVLLSLVALFAAVLLAVSARAKTVRESQTTLTMVSFLVLLPAVFSQFLGFSGQEREVWVKLTPVLNSAQVLREALLSRIDWPGVGLTVSTSLILALAFLGIAVRTFESEKILGKE